MLRKYGNGEETFEGYVERVSQRIAERQAEVVAGITPRLPTTEEAQAQQQASDIFTLQRAKEILCELWKAGKIDMSLRNWGEIAIAAALEATENPSAHKLSPADGYRLIVEQWNRENEREDLPF